MKSYDIVLTNDADTSKKLYGIFAGSGVTQAATPYGMADAGAVKQIRIDSLHHGSGQSSATIDPYKYSNMSLPSEANYAGWDTSDPGHIRAGQMAIGNTVIDASWGGNYVKRATRFIDGNGITYTITSSNIYEGTGGGTTSVDTPGGGNEFTGGYAIFGDRIFFGRAVTATGASTVLRVRTGTTVGTYANCTSAAPNGSYLAVVGSRMYVVNNAATSPKPSVKWTDVTGSSAPLFSTAYVYPSEYPAIDCMQLGPSLIVAIAGSTGYPGEIITMATDGTFTNLLPPGSTMSNPLRLVPFYGGVLVLCQGVLSNSFFMANLTSFAPLELDPLNPAIGAGTEWVFPPGVEALMAVSRGNKCYLMFKQILDGTVQNCLIKVDEEGRPRAYAGILGSLVSVTGAILCGNMFVDANYGADVLHIVYVAGSPANDLTERIVVNWNGDADPGGNQTKTLQLITSDYPGDNGYNLKQFLRVSGRVEVRGTPDANQSLTIKLDTLGVTGVYTERTVGTLTGSSIKGWFSFELDETFRGRTVSLALVCDDTTPTGATVDIVCPIIIDYVEIPNQSSDLTLTLDIGTLQTTNFNNYRKQSTLDVIAVLEDMVADPSPWTLTWGDNRDFWKVVPVTYRIVNNEKAVRPGDSEATLQLSLRRVRDVTVSKTV